MLESNSRVNMLFFIFLVAQLVPRQTKILTDPICNTRAYVVINYNI